MRISYYRASRRIAGIALASLVMAFAAPEALLAQPGGDDGPENLQVFSASISEDQLREIMSGYTEALGVNCTYCHVREPGQFPDFASDAKPEKETARQMIRMVQAINGWHLSDLPTAQGAAMEVTCMTCHHGVTRPQTLDRLLAGEVRSGGVEAALATYDDLREEYFGTAAYDFSEVTFIRLAQSLIGHGDADEALAVLGRNLEMFPNSTDTHVVMSQAYLRLGNVDQAIASLENAAALEPDNGRLQQQLEQLRNPE